MTLEKINLNGILENCISSYYVVLKQNNIIPEIRIPDNKVLRQGNENALTRVLGNIISNAIKYSDGDLNISLSEDGEIIFSGTVSVKQDWQSYTFINTGAYLFYNNGDKTWDCSWSAWQEVVDTAISEAIANSGFQTEEQVHTLIN